MNTNHIHTVSEGRVPRAQLLKAQEQIRTVAQINTNNPNSDLRSANWRGVFFDGPEPDPNADGDDHDARSAQLLWGNHLVAGLGSQIPIWHVYVGNEEAEPIATVYRCYSYQFAAHLAQRMSRDRKLELIQDAMPA